MADIGVKIEAAADGRWNDDTGEDESERCESGAAVEGETGKPPALPPAAPDGGMLCGLEVAAGRLLLRPTASSSSSSPALALNLLHWDEAAVGVKLISSSLSAPASGMWIRPPPPPELLLPNDDEPIAPSSSSESKSRNSAWNVASFHSSAASASELGPPAVDGPAVAKSSPNGSSAPPPVEGVDWKTPQS